MSSPSTSRPASQQAQVNLAYNSSGCGVKSSASTTLAKLGFVSPAYETGRPGAHGIIGGVGYLSASFSTLLPSTGPRARDHELLVHRQNHRQRSGRMQGGATGSERPPTLTTTMPSQRAASAPSTSSPTASAAGMTLATGTGTAGGGRRGGGGRLSQVDLEYLRENERRNQDAWEVWRRRRDAEAARQKTHAQE